MKRKKICLIPGLVFSLMVALLGFAPERMLAAEVPKPKIAILMPSLQGYVYVGRAYGELSEAQEQGFEKPILLAAGGYDKLDVQVKQIEDAIAAGVNAIVIMPLSEEAMVPAIDRAVEKVRYGS